MVIHTKAKTKIHAHTTRASAVKGSNVYTVERKPKLAGRDIVGKSFENATRRIPGQHKYRRSTVHAVRREGMIAGFQRQYREARESIKIKDQKLHIAEAIGKEGAKAAASQLDGGQEVQRASGIAYELSRPAVGSASRGAALFKRQVAEKRKNRIRKVDAGKRFLRHSSRKQASEAVKAATKENAKTVAKTTAVGSTGAPAGMATDYAAGKTVGAKIERDDRIRTNRIRKIKFFLDKTKDEEHQKDSVFKLVKDLVARRISEWVRVHSESIIAVLLIGILGILVMMTPVIATVGVLYNSPFAVFMPPLEEGDTVLSVTAEYVDAFNQEVDDIAAEHEGTDEGEVVYVDYEGIQSIIEIASIGIRYPVIEGTSGEALNRGIGHMSDTAAIGDEGNCVLCGHNGSRHGTFFTPLNTVSIGDKVKLTDKNGEVHYYRIDATKVIEPTDTSIKADDGTKRLTLFTCANRGTMRFVCFCSPAVEADD